MKIEVRQLDPYEPKVIPFVDGKTKEIVKNNKVYVCEGFQILERNEDGGLIRETYHRKRTNG